MCGRYTHSLTWGRIVELYGLLFDGEAPIAPNDFGPRYNIAPTQRVPVVRKRAADAKMAEAIRIKTDYERRAIKLDAIPRST